MFDKFERSRQLAEEQRARRAETRRHKSKQSLKDLMKQRCTTIFIGGLDSIEQKIGYLWGQGKPFDTLTEREKLFNQLWKELRKEILDKGNLQVKLAMRQIDLFEVELLDYEVNYNEQ